MSTQIDAYITELLREWDELQEKTDPWSSIDNEQGHRAREIWVEIGGYLAARTCSDDIRELCLQKGLEVVCPCGKKDCGGVDYHDPFVDRKMSDLFTLTQDAQGAPVLRKEYEERLKGLTVVLTVHRPYCSPVFQGRIDDALGGSSRVIT